MINDALFVGRVCKRFNACKRGGREGKRGWHIAAESDGISAKRETEVADRGVHVWPDLSRRLPGDERFGLPP